MRCKGMVIAMDDYGNREIMSQNLNYYMRLHQKDRKQICEDLGICYSTFCDWVNGNKYPRIEKIEMLARYFGIQKSDLIESRQLSADETEEEPELEEIVILNRAAKKMSPENRKKLLEMAKVMFREDFSEDE